MRGAKEFEAANDRTPSIFIEREKNQVRWEEEEELYFIANIKVIIIQRKPFVPTLVWSVL